VTRFSEPGTVTLVLGAPDGEVRTAAAARRAVWRSGSLRRGRGQRSRGDSGTRAPSTTLRYDTHALEDSEREAAERLGWRLLGEDADPGLAGISKTPQGGCPAAPGQATETFRDATFKLERETGFEPATLCLGSRCSTT
jgi:hypothetical protein